MVTAAMGSVVHGTIGDLTYVIAWNGNSRVDVHTDWLGPVQQAVAGHA